MIVIQEAIYTIRNMHTGITYPDSSINRVIDGLEKLKTLQARSCEGCKYGKEEIECGDIRYFCMHKDSYYFVYSLPCDFCCNRYKAKEQWDDINRFYANTLPRF